MARRKLHFTTIERQAKRAGVLQDVLVARTGDDDWERVTLDQLVQFLSDEDDVDAEADYIIERGTRPYHLFT